MVKITLEFESVDAAIVGLGKLVGAPIAAKQPRKGRDDKGQPRGAYKPRSEPPAAAGQQPAPVGPTSSVAVQTRTDAKTGESTSAAAITGVQNGAPVSAPTGGVASDVKTGVTDPAKAEVAATPKSTVPETPEPAAAHAGSTSTGAPPRTYSTEPAQESMKVDLASTRTFQEAEAAFKAFFNAKGVQPARELFAKFKIARITELQPEQYAEFVNAAR
jgi:hypothetical protein